MSQIALAWHFSKPYITSPIVGATKPNHISDAVAASEFMLTAEEIKQLEEPYEPHPVCRASVSLMGHDRNRGRLESVVHAFEIGLHDLSGTSISGICDHW